MRVSMGVAVDICGFRAVAAEVVVATGEMVIAVEMDVAGEFVAAEEGEAASELAK